MSSTSSSKLLFWAFVSLGLVAMSWPQVGADRDQELDQSTNYDLDSSSQGSRLGGASSSSASGYSGSGQVSNNEPNPNKISKAADLLASKQAGDLMGGFGGLMGGLDVSGQLSDDKKALASKQGPFNIVEWCKLMFNPVELVKAICVHFKLDFEKVSGSIGRHVIYGAEALLTPLVVTSKIVEKVFVPDACRLKFVCKMGAHLEFIKGHVLKFSSKFLEGSNYLKAFSEGIVGRDCELAFAGCTNGEPKLTKQYQEMRALQQPQSIGSEQQQAATGAPSESTQFGGAEATSEQPNQRLVQKASKSAVNRISATS